MNKEKTLDSIKHIVNKAYHSLQITGEKIRLLIRSAGDEKEPGDDRVAQAEEQLALANALSRIVLSSSDLNELCEGFAGELKELASIDWAAIALIDRSTEVLRLSPLSAKINSTWDLGETIPLEGTPVAWLVQNQQAMLEPDLKHERRFRTGNSLIKQGIRTVVYMPLFSRKEVFGGLILGSRRPDTYGERELRLLKYTTTQLAMAIENSRLFRESRDGVTRQAEFISALTHELKTPLTPIRASSELLAEELQEADTQSSHTKLAENIVRSAYSLDSKLSVMLELAKAQSPAFKLQLKRLDIKPLLEEIVVQLRPIVQSKEQSLSLEIPDFLPPTKADRQQLERVLLNLMSNATKVTPSGGNITLRAKKKGTELVVEVQDSGEGFSSEELERLFKVYYPADTDRQHSLELRLGLALNKQLIELHRGRMWVESKVGMGSTYAFSLPVD